MPRTRKPSDTLASRLKQLREASGLSQAELARALGWSKQRVSKLEQPGPPPKVETVLRLARALGCEAAELDSRLS